MREFPKVSKNGSVLNDYKRKQFANYNLEISILRFTENPVYNLATNKLRLYLINVS